MYTLSWLRRNAANKGKWKKECSALCRLFIYEVVFLSEIVCLLIPWRASLVMSPISNDVQFWVQLNSVNIFICWLAIVSYGVLLYVDPVTSAVDGRRLLNIANKGYADPGGLRRVSAAACLLGLRVRIRPRAWMSVSFRCCVLSNRDSVKGLSFVQRSPTMCGVFDCDLETSTVRRPWPTRAV